MNEYTIGGAGRIEVSFSDFGATWLSCRVPVPGGEMREVTLRHARLEHYITEPGCLGGMVGRYANRIGQARFRTPAGRLVELAANERGHCLHGGAIGFHRRPWRLCKRSADALEFVLHSPAGDQGFPGALDVGLRVSITAAATVRLQWWATLAAAAPEPCPVSLTSHAYFNLDGHGDARRQRLRIAGSHMLPTDEHLIPTGVLRHVAGTPFDLRAPVRLDVPPASHPDLALAGGYDHCWLLDHPRQCAAELTSADGLLAMRLHTSSPALQFYGGQYTGRVRSGSGWLPPFAGVALEPQYPPDAPKHPSWPSPWLEPGQRTEHWIEYTFGEPGRG